MGMATPQLPAMKKKRMKRMNMTTTTSPSQMVRETDPNAVCRGMLGDFLVSAHLCAFSKRLSSAQTSKEDSYNSVQGFPNLVI